MGVIGLRFIIKYFFINKLVFMVFFLHIMMFSVSCCIVVLLMFNKQDHLCVNIGCLMVVRNVCCCG